jgi:hypothetical protein
LLRLVIALTTLVFAASATPITWNLTDVTFADGSTASGTFVFDADTNTYSSINIVTTAGTFYSAETFGYVCTSPCNGAPADADDMLLLTQPSSSGLKNTPAFGIFLPSDQPLTDGGGDIPLSGSTGAAFLALCANSTCGAPTGFPNYVVSGDLDAPEPSAALLVGTAAVMFGVGRFRRRKRS